MKIAFIILIAMSLTQSATQGHRVVVRDAFNAVQKAAEAAFNNIKSLGNTIGKAIVDANDLINKYSDQSTDYAAEYRANSKIQINDMIHIALNETSALSNNTNVMNCFNLKRNDTKNFVQTAFEDVSRCVITKVKQFTDVAVSIAILANSTYNLIPNTNQRIKNCDREANDFFKIGCITWASAEASVKLAELTASVATTVASATKFTATFRSDLDLCTQARMLVFRRKLAEIPLSFGICAAQTVKG